MTATKGGVPGAGGTAGTGGLAKRASPGDHQRIPSRRPTKLPRKLDDYHLPRFGRSAQGAADGKRAFQWGAKRARTALGVAPTTAPLTSSNHKWRDWANLADGPAGLIAERLLEDDVADYLRFPAVCTAWRRCAADPHDDSSSSLDSRFLPRRWIMLWEDALHPAAPHRRRFLNVATGQCVRMDLPEIQGHCAFGPTAEGLLVLVDEHTLVVRLLNPFTRQLTELPSLDTLLPLPRDRLKKCLSLRKTTSRTCYAGDLANGYLSVGAAGLAGEGMVALYISQPNVLAVASARGERWTVVDQGSEFMSLLSFAGRFYCVSRHSSSIMMVTTTSENQPPCLVVAAELASRFCKSYGPLHLVENGRELILVCRTSSLSSKIEVYRVDLDERKTMRIHGLNGQAVFTGRFRALSVCPRVFPSICADTLYPGFELSGKLIGYKFDAYHLSDRSTEVSSSSYDVRSMKILKRPYRIVDVISWYIRCFHDEYDEPTSHHVCCASCVK